jgi:hypothetical protein
MILTAVVATTYPVVIQFKRGGLWWVLAVPGFAVWLLDVLANYIELPLIFGWPRRGDFTITARIKRMQTDPAELPARRELASLAQVFLDACEPDGKH